MSNCVVGSGGLRLPCSIIAEHSVESCDHFSHDGDDDDLGFFVGVGEAIVAADRLQTTDLGPADRLQNVRDTAD